MAIPVIRGRLPGPGQKEFLEFQQYDSGRADQAAAKLGSGAEEPWLEVINQHEPSALPAIDRLLSDAAILTRIRGRVIDVGAGTCLLSARLSQLPAVESVYALDLSERFLTSTGIRVARHFGVMESKLTFVASDCNDIPLEIGTLDAAFIFAAIHHGIRRARRQALALSAEEIGRAHV